MRSRYTSVELLRHGERYIFDGGRFLTPPLSLSLLPWIRSKGKFRFRRGKWNGRGDYAEITPSDSNLPGHAMFDHCLQSSLSLAACKRESLPPPPVSLLR